LFSLPIPHVCLQSRPRHHIGGKPGPRCTTGLENTSKVPAYLPFSTPAKKDTPACPAQLLFNRHYATEIERDHPLVCRASHCPRHLSVKAGRPMLEAGKTLPAKAGMA
jgi:hypothetical protein